MIDAVVLGEIIFDITVGNFTCEMHRNKVTRMGRPADFSGGGDAQNAATTMGNLGMMVYLAGRIGDDEAGRMCMSLTESAGVNCSRVLRVRGASTSTSVNLVNPEGEASHVHFPGENPRYATEDVPFDLFPLAKYVSLHSLLALPGLDAKAIFSKARESGARTYADTTPLAGNESIDMIADILPFLDVFAPSYSEAVILLKMKDPREMAKELLARGVGLAVIKTGADGCVLGDKDGIDTVPAYKTEVVNTTGAGDNFSAGFLCGLCGGYSKISCAKLGNAAGAITVSSFASTGAVKSFAQIENYIASRGDRLE
ncbi:MAG: carbohydrate kinase family protein [Synergistaceae bacterium]|jgi:sugar/nucleoside kinase (ribokinase family)|nr:carbohydrate kinase family protein [Synergistaceae bacterium]